MASPRVIVAGAGPVGCVASAVLAEGGVDVIVARGGQPVAKIIRWPPLRPSRQPGAWAGQVAYRDDVVGPDPDVAEMFANSTAEDLP